MKFAILKLVLWHRSGRKAPRTVAFSPGKVNLVAGESKTGKSAIIKIIDYCLGSSGCTIPKIGPIRRSCGWYGVLVATREGQKLIARRDPDEQEATDAYMLVEGPTVQVPPSATENANRDTVAAMLTRLAELPQLGTDFEDSGSGYKGRASFSDMTSLLFQPQSVVANDSVLFYEAQDERHARKLREIFPLVLGAVNADVLVNQHRLVEIRSTLDRLRRRQDVLSMGLQDYLGELRGRYTTAIRLGLAGDDIGHIETLSPVALRERLRAVLQTWNTEQPLDRNPGLVAHADRLAAVRAAESALAAQVSTLRLRLTQIRELRNSRRTAETTLTRLRDRVAPVSWVLSSISGPRPCPFCGGENETASAEFAALRRRTEEVEAQWTASQVIPPVFDAEEMQVRWALGRADEQLRQTRDERALLEKDAEQPEHVRRAFEERAVFVGKLEEFLRIAKQLEPDGELAEQTTRLAAEESRLREIVNASAITERKAVALDQVSMFAQHYGDIVDLETKHDLIKLDTNQLRLGVVGKNGRMVWMNQIGSGANWLGYHVAIMLALHEFFVTNNMPYVPSLLVFDQPSQTQFADDTDKTAEKKELGAVRRAFDAFSAAIARTDGALQIIVSEHAANAVVEGVERVNILDRWRDGRKLVPWDWDVEALEEMSGQSAVGALTDILDNVVLPALQQQGKIGNADLWSIASAEFRRDGIAFTVGSSGPDNGRVSGLVRADLSVETVAGN